MRANFTHTNLKEKHKTKNTSNYTTRKIFRPVDSMPQHTIYRAMATKTATATKLSKKQMQMLFFLQMMDLNWRFVNGWEGEDKVEMGRNEDEQQQQLQHNSNKRSNIFKFKRCQRDPTKNAKIIKTIISHLQRPQQQQ